MKVSDFVEGSVNHILHVGKDDTDEKIWELVEEHIYLVVSEVKETNKLHGEEKYYDGYIEEESSLVIMTCQSYKVDHEGGPKLDSESPCGSHK